MHFLILTQYYEPEIGAPQLRLASFSRELLRAGHTVEVVTALPNYPHGAIAEGYRGRLYLREVRDGIPVHRMWLHASMGRGLSRLFNYLSFSATSLVGLKLARRPDFLFVESPPLTLAASAIAAAKLWRVPVIVNIADLWPDMVEEIGAVTSPTVLRLARRLEKWVYANATYVSAVTEGIFQRLRDGKRVPIGKLLYLPNGVDTTLFRPDVEAGDRKRELGLDGKKVFLYAGTLGYFQGLDFVLKALRLVQDQDPELQFVFVGDGSERPALERQARELGLANTRFLPAVTPAEVARLYSMAYAGLVSLRDMPSTDFSRPSKIWPVMSCARPLVFIGGGEAARLIEQNDVGVVLGARDVEAAARGIVALGRDAARAKALGENGRRFAENEYSWAALVEKWLGQLDRGQRAAVPTGAWFPAREPS